MALFSDIVIFFRSIIELTPNEQFLDRATVAVSERNVTFSFSLKLKCKAILITGLDRS